MLFFKVPYLDEKSVFGQTLLYDCSINRVEQNGQGVLENAFFLFEKMITEVDKFSKKSKNSSFSKNRISSKKSLNSKRQGGFCRARSPLQSAPMHEVIRLDFFGLMIFLRQAFFSKKKRPNDPKIERAQLSAISNFSLLNMPNIYVKAKNSHSNATISHTLGAGVSFANFCINSLSRSKKNAFCFKNPF